MDQCLQTLPLTSSLYDSRCADKRPGCSHAFSRHYKRREVTMTTTTDRRSMELEGHTLAFLKVLEAQGHLTHKRAEK